MGLSWAQLGQKPVGLLLNDFICPPSSDGGIVSPRGLAVLRLITSSNVVGCSMGRSPSLAPLRILSTYTAAERKVQGLEPNPEDDEDPDARSWSVRSTLLYVGARDLVAPQPLSRLPGRSRNAEAR